MITSLPNLLTLSRIGVIPAIVALFWLNGDLTRWVMLGLYTFACLTDFFDGYAARSMGNISNFGKFLDPVADKLMIAVTLVLLTQHHPTALFAIPAAIIIGREITISSLREWMAQIGETARVAVSTIGKIKTSVQMLSLIHISEPTRPY